MMDEDRQENLNRKAQQLRERELDDLRVVLGSKQGRRFMRRLLEESGNYRTSFNTEALIMAFNEGQRNMGLWTIGEIHQASQAAYDLMQREYRSDSLIKEVRENV